ncbi:MAG: hypothetical protein QXX87_00960 [Candidatus Jordarchaeales archaeon]
MIIGYMLLSAGGIPVVTSSAMDMMGDMESLFAGAMTAINSIIAEVMKTRVRYVRTEKYHLYFSYSSELTLVLISEVEEPRLHQLADAALSEVLRTIDDPSRLAYDSDAQNFVSKVIREVLAKRLPPISVISKVADMLAALSDSIRGGMKLGLGKIIFIPRELKVEKVEVKAKGKGDIKKLVELFLNGDLESVVEEAPAFFESDLARILYAKAALKINSFPPEVKAPSLDRVYSVILSVKDDLARSLLAAELRRFLEAGTYYEREKLIEEKLFELSEKFKLDYEGAGAVYIALTLPAGRRELLELAEQLIGEQYQYFRQILKTTPSLLKSSILSIGETEGWSAAVGRVKYESKRVTPGPVEASYNYLLAFQLAILCGLVEGGLDFEAGRELLSDAIREAEKKYDSLRKLSKNVPSDVLAANYWFTYNALTGILMFTLPAEDIEKEMLKYGERIAEVVSWLMDAAKRNRISVDMYILAMAGMLAAYSRLMFLLGTPIPDLPYYVKQLAIPELERIWDYSPHHYLHLVMDCLEALGHTASFLPMETARKNILKEIAANLEEIYKTASHTPVMSILAALSATRFYVLCGDEEAKEKARKLAEKISEVNEFFASLVEKTINIDKALRRKPSPYDVFV